MTGEGAYGLRDIFVRLDQLGCRADDGRILAAVCEPFYGNRFRAAWSVFRGRAYALKWPKPGDLEKALGIAEIGSRPALPPMEPLPPNHTCTLCGAVNTICDRCTSGDGKDIDPGAPL